MSHNTPLFSILIANYNDGKLILDAIDSIKKQHYNNYEVIIVDDGSTDTSRDILHDLELESKFHVYYNGTNYGCGYTKRRLVELSHGDICGFLDADDALTEDAITVMVEKHNAYPDVGLVYSNYYYCEETLTPLFISSHQCTIPDGESFLNYKRGAISHFVTFKKEYYMKTMGINKEYLIAEDIDLYLKLEEVSHILFLNTPLYYYRGKTGNNTSLDKNILNAICWEIIAKTDACNRRHVNRTTVEFPIIEELSKSIVSVSDKDIRESREYKLGNYLMHPMNFIKKLINTFMHKNNE